MGMLLLGRQQLRDGNVSTQASEPCRRNLFLHSLYQEEQEISPTVENGGESSSRSPGEFLIMDPPLAMWQSIGRRPFHLQWYPVWLECKRRQELRWCQQRPGRWQSKLTTRLVLARCWRLPWFLTGNPNLNLGFLPRGGPARLVNGPVFSQVVSDGLGGVSDGTGLLLPSGPDLVKPGCPNHLYLDLSTFMEVHVQYIEVPSKKRKACENNKGAALPPPKKKNGLGRPLGRKNKPKNGPRIMDVEVNSVVGYAILLVPLIPNAKGKGQI